MAERYDSDEVFPQNSTKTYALVELVKGTSTMVDRGPEDTIFAFPRVLLIEIVLLLAITLGIFAFSLVKSAPLEAIANPQVTTNPAKAPWYFVGLQELLEHMHPTLAGVIIPTLLVLFLLALPYIDQDREGAGRWFTSIRGRRITLLTALYSVVVMPGLIVLDNLANLRETLRNIVPPLISTAVLPGLILAGVVVLPVLVLRRWKPTTREIMIALFTVMIVFAAVLTLSGFLFRGPGFKLYWPWLMPNGYNPLDNL
jgi:quinol-cytochrome oxidoreductase complex cytochrome b subunit